MTLVCGGRGPCCHVGYAHRHCEHCDMVIPTYACHHHYFGGWMPNWAGYYAQPAQYGTFMANGLAGNLQGSLQALQAQFNQLEEPKK